MVKLNKVTKGIVADKILMKLESKCEFTYQFPSFAFSAPPPPTQFAFFQCKTQAAR